MENKLSIYNSYVVKSILANNQYNIKEVSNLESIHSRCFIKIEYPHIESLIKEKNIEAIKKLHSNEYEADEYLDIMTFSDQNQSKYIVTVYDSDALEQDPQVIKIYPL